MTTRERPCCGGRWSGKKAAAVDQRIRTFRASLRLLEREVERALQSQTSCCGVTSAQCHLLLELDEAGCQNVTALAARLDLDKSTLSRTVDGLVNAGLLSRDTDPSDRRQQVICLNEAGEARVAQIHRLCDAQYQRLFERIPRGKHELVREAIALVARAMLQQRRDDADQPMR